MLLRIYCVFVAILCLIGFSKGAVELEPFGLSENAKKTNSNVIIDKYPFEQGAGSGGRKLDTSDDEDLVESGSGSGSGMGDINTDVPLEKTTTVTTSTTFTTASTSRPMSPCEKVKQASRQLSGKIMPRCLPNGEYDSLQCQGHSGSGDCWCSDLEGKEIPGTHMEAPAYPDCDSGVNLKPCIHQLVQHVRSKLLGSFRPKCTADGLFDRMQCHGSMCFCVDERLGSLVTGTEVHIPDEPNCDDEFPDVNTPELTTSIVLTDKDKSEENIVIDEDIEDSTMKVTEGETIDLDIDIGGGNTVKGKDSTDTDNKFLSKDNKSNNDREEEIHRSEHDGHHSSKVEKAASEIMTQPGILAGIIGGSVVLLLCVVLLVMFVVYRMRKKDEGSYPLDEPRKPPNYNYVRAPEKEFYA